MHFSNEAEAFLAIAALVISADKVGTAAERKQLFDHIGAMQPFKGMNPSQFNGMMADVNAKLFATEDAIDDLMKPAGISQFSSAVKGALPGDRVETAMKMACELAIADGLLRIERGLLEQLATGLGMTKDNIRLMLRNYDAKNAF